MIVTDHNPIDRDNVDLATITEPTPIKLIRIRGNGLLDDTFIGVYVTPDAAAPGGFAYTVFTGNAHSTVTYPAACDQHGARTTNCEVVYTWGGTDYDTLMSSDELWSTPLLFGAKDIDELSVSKVSLNDVTISIGNGHVVIMPHMTALNDAYLAPFKEIIAKVEARDAITSEDGDADFERESATHAILLAAFEAIEPSGQSAAPSESVAPGTPAGDGWYYLPTCYVTFFTLWYERCDKRYAGADTGPAQLDILVELVVSATRQLIAAAEETKAGMHLITHGNVQAATQEG